MAMAVKVLRRMNYLSQEGLQQTIYLSVLQSKPIESFDKTIAIHKRRQTHSNFRIFKFCVLFNFVYQIIYEIKSLQNFTLRYIFNHKIFQIYGMYNTECTQTSTYIYICTQVSMYLFLNVVVFISYSINETHVYRGTSW